MKSKKMNFQKEKGITLVEVLLSVALLVIIAAPLLGVVVASVKNTTTAKDKTEAIALAEKVMGEIKAWKLITPTPTTPGLTPVVYNIAGSRNLVPYYEIVLDEVGNIVPSGSTAAIPSIDTTYTYGIPTDDSFDFELVINQDTVDLYKIESSVNKTRITPLTGLPVNDKLFKFKVSMESGEYKYFFGEESKTETMTTLEPKDTSNPSNPNKVKLKVTYAPTVVPSSCEQLKIYTCIDTAAINFEVYLLNINEANSRVSFINKGTTNFEVNYVDTDAFKYNATNPLNSLYKIKVIIKKNEKVIYENSSYVKK